MEKSYPKVVRVALILSLLCFILGIITKLGGFYLVASPRSFIVLTVVGLLFALNLSLLQLIGTKKE